MRALWTGGRGPASELRLTGTQPADINLQLDALAPSPNTRLTCIVAGEGVRYRIVPWRDELSRPPQRQLLAEQCFSEAYGEAARGWTVRNHATRYGSATLACAIDTALLDQLAAQSLARRLTLASVQPALMHAYNQARHSMSPGLHWFVLVDAVSTTLLLLSPTEPLLVKRIPSIALDLADTLDREWFALGMEPPRCAVYLVRSGGGAPMPMASRSANAPSWSFVDLTPSGQIATLAILAAAVPKAVHA
jgi:hypothetical protein